MRSGPTRIVGALLVCYGFAAATGGLQAQDKIDGTWMLNTAKSKFSPGPAPKSMTVTYTPAGDSMKIVVDTVPAEGAAQHWE